MPSYNGNESIGVVILITVVLIITFCLFVISIVGAGVDKTKYDKTVSKVIINV